MQIFSFGVLLVFINCGGDFSEYSSDYPSSSEVVYPSEALPILPDSDIEAKPSTSSSTAPQAGQLTAGALDDLNDWTFWSKLRHKEIYSNSYNDWNFYTEHRVPIVVTYQGKAAVDVSVALKIDNKIEWEAKTDNLGSAQLWINLFKKDTLINIDDYQLFINGKLVQHTLGTFGDNNNEIALTSAPQTSNTADIAFVVDATGSMSDELQFLKQDLAYVIQTIENNNATLNVRTASVFYRDQQEEYLTIKSDFSSKISTTLDFIKEQSAHGGGDFPEAVHSGLKIGIDELSWSKVARSRIAFLLLDAPPHYETEVVSEIKKHISTAAKKGIKIIPIVASGINKETEFLMRHFAVVTNAQYVFITNDSGIGNSHIDPTAKQYTVKTLTQTLIDLIEYYSK